MDKQRIRRGVKRLLGRPRENEETPSSIFPNDDFPKESTSQHLPRIDLVRPPKVNQPSEFFSDWSTEPPRLIEIKLPPDSIR
jgi:hypothetical protein